MATTFANSAISHSDSIFRTSRSAPTATYPQTDLTALTALPNVDLNFEDLRQRMAAFTAKFDAFIEKGRKRVLEERNEFRGQLAELNEDQKSTQSRISALSSTLDSHSSLLARESAEKSDMESSISQLSSTLATHTSTRDRLKQHISQTQRAIDSKLEAQRAHAERLDGQAGQNAPELAFWEEHLGMRIEGAGDEDLVRVIYIFEGQGKEEKEGLFELDVSGKRAGGGNQVVYTRPKLAEGEIRVLTDGLNERRDERGDLGVFLKGMRRLFVEALKS